MTGEFIKLLQKIKIVFLKATSRWHFHLRSIVFEKTALRWSFGKAGQTRRAFTMAMSMWVTVEGQFYELERWLPSGYIKKICKTCIGLCTKDRSN
jgi:hypothetical protein